MLFYLPTLGQDPRDPGVILTTFLFSLPYDKPLLGHQIHLSAPCSLFTWAHLFSPGHTPQCFSTPVPSTNGSDLPETPQMLV